MHKPSPALVVSLLALVVATTGTAAAAGVINGASIRPHSITQRQLANGAVTSRVMARGAVTSRSVSDHAIEPAALADGVIVNNTVVAPAGPQGAAGELGPQGPAGQQGPTGIAGAHVVVVSMANASSVTATCPAGETVIGGGYAVDPGVVPSSSAPWSNGAGTVGWRVTTPNAGGIVASAICASVG